MNDDQDEARDTFPESMQSGRARNPSATGLRQRSVGRAAAAFVEGTPQVVRRSSSFVSESLSESRRSFRSSTDDLFLPRATTEQDINLETSHWHSLPLGLALLPAVGGLFFQNGSAFITDISLLGLAALFLNWAVRLPWDWYLSAQAVVSENESHELGSAVEDDNSEDNTPRASSPSRGKPELSTRALAARSELRAHELLALSACFAFPALGAWLLHAIRSQLSRPSEGLVSDYNLTIFILAAEVRPLSHLLELIQRRTLFLQRTINASAFEKLPDQHQLDPTVLEMTRRLEDLESHIANSVLLSSSKTDPGSPSPADDLVTKASNQANADIRKSMQPELDALNRAMRRYEKRFTISATQIETRLQELESRMQDTIILAAATQRNANKHAGRYAPILLDWVSACVVVPVRYTVYIVTLPQRVWTSTMNYTKRKLGFAVPAAKGKDGKTGSRGVAPRQRKEKPKVATT